MAIPKISIIVPIYNVETYLEECLDSVLRQDFQDYEIVCVDDGSTDGSSDIIGRYAMKDARITVFRQENAGLSCARNTGIEVAKGEYICFLDADDLLKEDTLSSLWDACSSGDVDIITFENELKNDYEDSEKQSGREKFYYVNNSYDGVKSGRKLFCERIENNEYVDSACLMLIKRTWLTRHGICFYPRALYEDSVFSLKCYFQCEKMRHLHKRLYIYRLRTKSITTSEVTEDTVYYRIWHMIEAGYMLLNGTSDERERSALTSFIKERLATARVEACRISSDRLKCVLQMPMERQLALQITGVDIRGASNGWHLRLDGLIQKISQFDIIILYGAGIVGEKTFRYLKMYGLEDRVSGFAVSSKENEQELYGKSVKSITEYPADNNVIVLIAAAESTHGDIIDRVEKCGFRYYYPIDYELESGMDEVLESGLLS